MSKRILHFLIGLFLFTFPLERFGIVIGGYPVTIPFIAISMISLMLVIYAKFKKRQAIVAISLLIWIIGSLIVTGRYSSIISVFMFIIMLIPSLSILPPNLENTAFKWLIRGSILSLVFALYDAFSTYTGAPAFQDISPLFLTQNIDQGIFFRLKSTFLEPSVYAIYLAFMIIILDYIPVDYMKKWKRYLLFTLYSLALVMTLSISGWILIAIYYLTKILLRLSSILKNKVHFNAKSVMLALAGIVIIGILSVPVSNMLEINISEYAYARLFRTAQVTTQGNYENEGTRTNIYKVVLDYFSKTGVEGILIGEGFNSYESWLIENYSRALRSTMIEGKISNTYAVIALGSGAVGLILYLFLITSFMPLKLKRLFDYRTQYILCYFIVWVTSQFATGTLILYYIWGYLFIFFIIVNSYKNKLPQPQKAYVDNFDNEIAGPVNSGVR
ncbi:MAG: O-antigen ligase family protein [Armatimonadota bacterium]